jgi:hypothetical protein
MKKKIIIIVLSMYLFCTLASPIVFAEEESEKVQALSIFPSEINIEFSNNLTDEPISPLQKQEVDIKVKFKLDMSSIGKWFFFKRRIGRAIMFGISYIIKMKSLPNSNLSVKISESPAWCSVTIDTNSFVFNLNDLYKSKDSSVEKTVKLEYPVNENAPALEKGEIKIQADFIGFGGIKATSNSTSIFITTAFIPNLVIEAESELVIPPLQNTTVPINITNNGNGDSIISIIYTNPENWTTTFDLEEFTIQKNETKQVNLTVYPPKEFTNQTINISFIPKPITGEYEEQYFTSSIIFINDGSLEEKGIQDVLVVGIIILIIIILLVFILLFLGKKK